MMNNKRPVGILRYNAEIMRNNGAPKEVIQKYLTDNGSSFDQIVAVRTPNQDELSRMLESEKDGSFAAQQQAFNEASERSKKAAETTEGLKQVQGGLRAFGNGLFFGAGDEIESALTGTPVEQIRAEQKQYVKDNPYKSTAYNVVGAIANPVSRMLPVAKGASLGSKIAQGALQGAGYGAAYGFGEGEGGFENRLVNALKQGKTGAIIGGSIPVVAEGVKQAGKGLAHIVGQTSGAGGESLKRAYEAGTRNSEVFKDAMRGKSGVYDVVDDVDNAVRSLERSRSEAFKKALPKDGNFKIPETAIKDAFKNATSEISGVTAGVDDVAADALNKVDRLMTNVKYSGGWTFNNAMEAKKAIDGIIEPLSRSGEKNAVRILKPIQNALKDTMVEAVPEYADALRDFSKSSKIIDAVKGALTSKDPTTELRKIQGITRQSVAAAQGGKQELGKLLDAVSGGKILDAVAGQQVQQWIPRDPVRALGAGAAAFGAKALNANPMSPLMLTAFSPRASGEVAFKLGQIASKLPESNTNAILRIFDALQKR
ncbi:MAG: hypothetical protein II238_00645 [Alphaproteobacteria bacterium]|nr:hypothetical protein [Alphaproteobacteria bacterium]